MAHLSWYQRKSLACSAQKYASYTVLNDNQGATKLASYAPFHARTKHIDRNVIFMPEYIGDGTLKLKYISSKLPQGNKLLMFSLSHPQDNNRPLRSVCLDSVLLSP
ncbi:CYFA0S36e00716g1_1 [Cyberlindnera fabianii]|uniref:CYFA0S36e00716g1_1 n=1 Tax=Cyberlindnera fabianii TaxID=36022 RepID=A0A061BKX6_CYBFA|nr:CYFA0S36e00716g1_1 [Cyberlindnera fabianii]